MSLTKPVSVDALKKAICLKCANCYGAMAFANALGGTQTDAWYLCHNYTLEQILEEAEKVNVNLDELVCAVEPQPVKESLYYKRAKKLITEAEFKKEFSKWQRGEK